MIFLKNSREIDVIIQAIITQPANQPQNDVTTVIAEQPSTTTRIQRLKELAIKGFIKTLDQRNLQFFKVADNYLAYSQQIYCTDYFQPTNLCCCKSPFTECYSGNQLTIAYPDNTIEKIKIKSSFFSSKDIAFDSNNHEIIVLDNSNENSSLYLIKSKEFRQNSTSADKIEINLPQESILAASISANSNIYTLGIEENCLCLWTGNPIIENNTSENINWEKLTIGLPADSITDVAFSENSRYLFVRLNTGILNVYDYNLTWSKIAEVTGTTTFPVDIYNNPNPIDTDENEDLYKYVYKFLDDYEDKANTLMIFIEGKKLIIKTETNDLFYYDEFSNKLTTAHFIPGTKDLLIFDLLGNMTLAKYEDETHTLHFINYIKKNLPYKISNVYFDSTDNTKLTVLAEKKAIKLIKEKHQNTNKCCARLGDIISWPIYFGITGESISLMCFISIFSGEIIGHIIDWIDGFFDKNYIFNGAVYTDIKKTITLGDVVEQKALKTIQQPITQV